MTGVNGGAAVTRLSRRTALLAPLALAGCETISGWFSEKKDPLPGKRESLGALGRGFNPDQAAARVVLPPAVHNDSWPQPGGNPAHLMGNLSLRGGTTVAWTADLGEGGGFRRKILARPVAASGMVFAQDSDATISAWSLSTGGKFWRTETVPEDSRSTNVGGGLCWDNDTLYAVNGISEILALDPRTGAIKWRRSLGVSARSAPTVVQGRIYITLINSKLLCLSVEDGHELWNYQATESPTVLLGSPAPAYDQGIVVAGFGSGDVAALRAETGSIVWTDNLGLSEGKATLVDFQAIRGAPVIRNGQVFITGMGGLTISADLLSGRRVWERRVASADAFYVAGNNGFLISTDQEVGAINTDDSRVAWVSQLPRWENPEKKKDVITWFGPIAAGDRLIIVGSNKHMLWLDPATGQIVGTVELSDEPAGFAPIVVDNTLLVVTDDGRLTAYR